MSVFPKETIKNIGESLGVTNLKDEVATALAQDVEYRVHELIQEASKFMRHSKRTKLSVDDVNAALRVKNVEPLYGYACGDALKFRKTTFNNNDLYFNDDEEVDFETVLNKPLPKIPLDVTFTAHWLAIEGVQPAIPQNPTPSDAKAELLSKRTKSHASSNGITTDQVNVKPLVKHVLSKELQMYFERITEAVLSEDEQLQSQAFESLRMDPGLHQLLPYFIQHIHKKVTQNHKNLDILEAMLSMSHSLLNNKHLFVEPYLHQLIPPILSCMVGRVICENPQQQNHWATRRRAASLIATICHRYGKAYHTLQPRITKTLLRAFLDPARPLTTHYGAIIGLDKMGPEVTRVLVTPNIKFYTDNCLSHALQSSNPARLQEAAQCKEALVTVLMHIADYDNTATVPQNKSEDSMDQDATYSEQEKIQLLDFVGSIVGEAYLEKEHRRSHIKSLIELAQ
ncbi:Transcription initiation factor TFIID subunit 6 [Choanephora cucurbitarum]|uniref:TBP-associated factor 6 n=1 Tax=Choanephora cucurbitarum TaxID=101091 RepID=A0A1C7NGP7_9FUNG|nr:Transcription initiation factor TFIID subunit 6 [Choanephora cucurbitarum]